MRQDDDATDISGELRRSLQVNYVAEQHRDQDARADCQRTRRQRIAKRSANRRPNTVPARRCRASCSVFEGDKSRTMTAAISA